MCVCVGVFLFFCLFSLFYWGFFQNVWLCVFFSSSFFYPFYVVFWLDFLLFAMLLLCGGVVGLEFLCDIEWIK